MPREESPSAVTGWSLAVRSAAALAAAMGVGRFVFTPLLPLMEQQAHLAPPNAGLLASANYFGYLAGALLGVVLPWTSRSRLALRVAGVVLVLSLLLMPVSEDLAFWIPVRTVAGAASAVVFMVAGNALLAGVPRNAPHIAGWAYGGVGAGIAGSGLLVVAVSGIADWRSAWFSAAALAAILLAVAWSMGETGRRASTDRGDSSERVPRSSYRWFGALTVSYFLEGAGYIVSGTFLVAAVEATGPRWLAGSVWIIVGVAAVPSCALWGWLSGHVSRPTLIAGALALQAVGIALPALSTGAIAAAISAALLGATFVGITTLSLATGRHLGFPRAVAVLTAGYGVGQVIGPLLVAPTLGGGYRVALALGAALVFVAALAAGALRIRYPHGDQAHHGDRRMPVRTV
jgi:predicted MFS family arabinose efflux permease